MNRTDKDSEAGVESRHVSACKNLLVGLGFGFLSLRTANTGLSLVFASVSIYCYLSAFRNLRN